MSLKHHSFYALGYILSLFILLAVFVPELYALLDSYQPAHLFKYVNAWDEETYLSYQGALGARNIPGYYCLYLITFLHHLGLSGAIQNMLFDLVLIPLTVFFTSALINHYINNRHKAFFYAIIILFSSVLFNYTNPLIQAMYGIRHLSFFISGWESYASFIRTPNPLFSYFLLSFFLYLFLKTGYKVLLIVPLALLYYFVFIPYLYCLVVGCLCYYYQTNKCRYLLLFNGLAYLVIAAVSFLAFRHLLSDSMLHEINNYIGSSHIQVSRAPYIPLDTLVGAALLSLLFLLNKARNTACLGLFITLLCCSFFISNIQMITGLAIEIKSFQDYGNSLLLGIMLILFLESLTSTNQKQTLNQTAVLTILVLISSCVFYQLKTPAMQLNMPQSHSKLTEAQLAAIKQSPLTSLVLDTDLAAKISYSTPLMPPVLTSYALNFPFIFKQCSCFYSLAVQAKHYLNVHHNQKSSILEKTISSMAREKPIEHDAEYCQRICPKTKDLHFTVYE